MSGLTEKERGVKQKQRLYANLALLLCAFIWGTAFVAQSVGMEYVGPFTFHAVRSLLGSLTLIPVIIVLTALKKKKGIYKKSSKAELYQLMLGGISCGVVLCVACCFQQFGIQQTTVGKAGFITSMYMIFVPIFSVVLRKKVPIKIWLCVILAAIGLYFLSMNGSFGLSAGDSFVAVCAVCFAIHIMVVDYFAPKVDGVKLSCVQFLVSGVLAMVPMLIWERPEMAALLHAAIPIMYAGVMSCGVAYTLQIVGQKYASPTTATLLMSLESVFSLLGGVILLRQVPTPRELLGCALVFGAVVWAEL